MDKSIRALGSNLRCKQPGLLCYLGLGREVQGRTLATQSAKVGGVLGVASNTRDVLILRFNDHATTYTTVGAG